MITINLLIAAVGIYFLVVYIAHFAFGLAGGTDELDKLFIWLWPLYIEKIPPVANRLATRLKTITGHIAKFLRKPLFYLSLPFRPVTFGRLVRERYHLS